MSFILDALKKSEVERQRQAIPGLVESGPARSRPRLPAWAIGLGALLAVNLLFLSVMLLRSWMAAPTPAQPPPTGGVVGVGATKSAPPPEPFSPLDTAPVYAPEIPVGGAPDGARAPRPSPLQPETPGNRPRRRDPVLTDNDYKAGDEEVLPTINEINLGGAQGLPELHLDVHVYATNAAERFVYINMRKYHEGATLQEGPLLERIRRDGVILNYRGLRFLLPRQ